MKTSVGIDINDEMVSNRLSCLINQFYKILPIKENNPDTLKKYARSLLREMLGLKDLIVLINNDAMYASLLSILQYMISNECSVEDVRSDVFKSIALIKKLIVQYGGLRGDSCERMG